MKTTRIKTPLVLLCSSISLYAQPNGAPPAAAADAAIYDARTNGREVLTPKPGDAPVINGPAVSGCRPNRAFIYRIPCTGQRPMEFRVEGLPASLKLDAKNGVISGTSPSQAGDLRLVLHAKNQSGAAKREFTIAVGETLALTPPMGWNSWHIHYHLVTDAKVRTAAEAMVSSGLADAGYQYVCIDDCWMRIDPKHVAATTDPSKKTASTGLDVAAVAGKVRDEQGRILPNGNFPDMKALTDHIHGLGLKAGIYSSPGPLTCQKFAGSYQHEMNDARSFAEWGFDLLKYDWCSYGGISKGNTEESARRPYQIMGDALQQTDRDIVYSLCQYGLADVWKWGAKTHGNMWRTDGDLAHSIHKDGLYKAARKTLAIAKFAGPGHWNDPDLLQLGMWVSPLAKAAPPEPIKLSPNEQYSYMSLWCMLASPLIFSGDLTRVDEFTHGVLCNPEIIAVDQDQRGEAAHAVRMADKEWVLARPLADGSVAVALLNLDKSGDREVSVSWSELGLTGQKMVRDLWRQKDVGQRDGSFTVRVGPRGVCMIKIKGD